MYLKGSKWSMNRRHQHFNWFRIIVLTLLIAGGLYLDKFVIPATPSPFQATETPTRPPEAYITEAQTLFDQGKLLQSIQVYQEAVAVKPNDPSTYVAMARVQVFAGDYTGAQTSAEDALLLNANNSMAHAVRAWALDFLGNYLDAEASIKRALELDPNNAVAHAYYAEILVDEGPDTIQKAIDESKTALALAPNTLESHRARGYVLYHTGNYENAVREYQAATAINNNIADLHLQIGANYKALGIYDKAVQEFTLANALNPTDWQPNYLISRTYATVGEFAKAMQYAESAVNVDPVSPQLHGNLGVMAYHNAEWPSAAKELDLAVNGGRSADGQKIDPVALIPNAPLISEYYFTYALVLARLNRCGESLQVVQKIQALVPSDQIAMSNADAATKICQQNLASPAPSAIGPPAATRTPPAMTPTP
jgi:tetratricopeptide (TPR) repeat protein